MAVVIAMGAWNVAGAVNADDRAIMRAKEALREMRDIVDLGESRQSALLSFELEVFPSFV